MEPFIADFIRDSEIPKGLLPYVCWFLSKVRLFGAEFSAVYQQSHL